MSEPAGDANPDPSEVEPTDNSSGAPIDLDRVEELEDDAGAQ